MLITNSNCVGRRTGFELLSRERTRDRVWRKRAEEGRSFAEQMKDPAQRAKVLKAVEKYEQLAIDAEVHGTAGPGRRRGNVTKAP
jgi:hypothetical protein